VAKVADEVGATANSYQILAKLAVGGMAEIFLARGESVAGVERYCVLKRILRERAADAQFAQMFLDEARLAAQLQHPNIASVYDIGMLGDSYFFTMEYVHGETVRAMLARSVELGRPVPLACALTIVAGAAAGLHHAHERRAHDGRPLGIVHRDVSPSNVMVSFEGNVKIVDFGVAKAANRAVETRAGTVKGKISYLSPEQCRGDRVDRRSDLFSLGIVMWELLTCTRLYRRASDFDNMTAIVHEPLVPPSKHRRDVPRGVDDIVLRLLAKSPGDRFQTAAEVVEALENAAMRGGTILSSSALSRLVGELFGVRSEPWLSLDNDTIRNTPMSFVPRPIPREAAREPGDDLERSLASVIDLSSPSLSIELLEETDPPAESLVEAAALSALPSVPVPEVRNGRVSMPLRAPTPTALSSPMAAPPRGAMPTPPRGAMPTPTVQARSGAPAMSVAELLAQTTFGDTPAQPLNATLPWVGAPPPASLSNAPAGGTTTHAAALGQPARIPAASAALPVVSGAPILPVVNDPPSQPMPAARSGPRPRPSASSAPHPMPPTSSAPHPMPSMSSGPHSIPLHDSRRIPRASVRVPTVASGAVTAVDPRRPRRSHLTWPLMIVIVIAAAIGVVAAWLSMRDHVPL
jgi:eukaryotic-like serine/threonine-protein kinase